MEQGLRQLCGRTVIRSTAVEKNQSGSEARTSQDPDGGGPQIGNGSESQQVKNNHLTALWGKAQIQG